MPKGKAKKRDFISLTDSKKPEETDTPSAIDQGKDFIKAGES